MIKYYFRSILVSVGILILSLGNFSSLNQLPKVEGEDKIVHILMYAFLAFTLSYEFKKHVKSEKIRLKSHVYILLYCVVFGGAIELLQKFFFPPRTAEWMDWLGDIFGAILGIMIYKLIFKKKRWTNF